MQAWLKTKADDIYLKDLAYTLNARRTVFDWRSSFVAVSAVDLSDQMEAPQISRVPVARSEVIFLFTGQGAQWAGMGRELVTESAPFKRSLLESERMLQTIGASWHLMEELFHEDQTSRLGQSELAQPVCTAVQIGLVDHLAFLNISPTLVVGHSSGEIAAAYAAGALSHESALRVAFYRGLASLKCKEQNCTKGAMVAVGLAASKVQHWIDQVQQGRMSIACINSPTSTTVSGDEEGIEQLRSLLDAGSVSNRRLNVDVAYHSDHMLVASAYYIESLQGLTAGN